MKSCAKSKGLTTAQLLDKVRQSNETPCDCPSLVKKQMTLRNVLNKADDDFKQPPPPLRTKRRKRNAELDLLGLVELVIPKNSNNNNSLCSPT